MTFDEFQEKLVELNLPQLTTLTRSDKYSRWRRTYSYGGRKDKGETKDCIYAYWSTGGMSGGNCWNDDAPTAYTSSDKPEDLTDLDKIIEAFKADVSFIQYKALVNELVEYDTYTEYEYYGNSSNYAYKLVEIEKLYKYMNDKGWL